MRKVLINSLPKSGTNLVSRLFDLAGYEYSNIGIASTSIYGRYQALKKPLHGAWPWTDAVRVGLDTNAVVRSGWLQGKVSSLRDGQYMTGHLPYADQLMSMLAKRNVRAIYVTRDPRDVLLSWSHYLPKQSWHYAHGLYKRDADIAEHIRVSLDGGFVRGIYIESFESILNASMPWLEAKNTLVVKFENLIGAEGGGDASRQMECVREICDFTGLRLDDVRRQLPLLYGKSHTFRSGVIGGWGDELSDATRQLVMDRIGALTERFGYQK